MKSTARRVAAKHESIFMIYVREKASLCQGYFGETFVEGVRRPPVMKTDWKRGEVYDLDFEGG